MKEKLTREVLEVIAKCKNKSGCGLCVAYKYCNFLNGGFTGIKTYTRELPKTRARQIAEKISTALSSSDRYKPEVKIIEAVLEKYAEELGEENKPII